MSKPGAIDWAKPETYVSLYPAYRKEQIRMDNAKITRTNVVEVKDFNLKTPFGTGDIFVNTNLTIQPNKRCAVFGVNGSGKTCLFEAIANGEVMGFPGHLHVHHMKELEHDAKKDEMSVIDTVTGSHEYRNALKKVEAGIEKAMEGEAAKADEALMATLTKNLSDIRKAKIAVHGEEATAIKDATQMLRVLGFDEEGEKATLSSLSGGLRMRVALACAFFINPDLLLLDEPTNHLDLPSVLWLENKLRAYKGSFLLVTHDRTLLENVVSSVMLIQDLKLVNYQSEFKKFEREKENEDRAREKKTEEFLRVNKNIDPSNPKYKVKRNYELWMERRQERKVLLEGKFTFATPTPLVAEEGVNQKDISLIKIEDLKFSYNPETLPFIFKNPINYEIKTGTRVGIMGPNGAGKSTLLKLITGKLTPTEGTITHHPDFVTAYFGQHSTKELDLESSAIGFMKWKFPEANPGALRAHLAKTSIGESVVETRIKNLSFSQRSCVIFAALTFVPPHLLIMDEPTNFLDLESVDSLIGAVNKFSGAVVIVTHNRDFLKRTVQSFLSIIPGAFLEFETMKEAERATYSFITALEQGEQVDFQTAIQENRGGGAQHTDEDQRIRAAKLAAQQARAEAEAEAKEKERLRLIKEEEDKEKARIAKRNALKDDWVVGDKCWACHKGKWIEVEVCRVNPMGVTYKTPTNEMIMTDAKKLREENPQPAKPANNNGGNNRGRGKNNNNNRGGRGNGRGRGGNSNNSRGGGNNRNNNNNNSRGGYGNSQQKSNGGRGGRGRGRGRGGNTNAARN